MAYYAKRFQYLKAVLKYILPQGAGRGRRINGEWFNTTLRKRGQDRKEHKAFRLFNTWL